MGARTLEQFRTNLNLTLGTKRQENEQLDLWIEDGLNELFTILDSEGRRTSTAIPTVASQAAYTLPVDLVAVLNVKDTTNKKVLLKQAIENFERLDDTKEGKPRYYTREDREIILHPIPDGVFNLAIVYIKEHASLVLDTDVTDLPKAFDRPIQLLAQRAAFMDLGELEKATFFFQTAVNLVRSLPTELILEAEAPAVGIQVARSEADLTGPPQV